MEVIDKLRDEGEWVVILDSEGVQHMIVLYQSEGAILLFNEEDGGGHGQLGEVNSTRLKVLLEKASSSSCSFSASG